MLDPRIRERKIARRSRVGSQECVFDTLRCPVSERLVAEKGFKLAEKPLLRIKVTFDVDPPADSIYGYQKMALPHIW